MNRRGRLVRRGAIILVVGVVGILGYRAAGGGFGELSSARISDQMIATSSVATNRDNAESKVQVPVGPNATLDLSFPISGTASGTKTVLVRAAVNGKNSETTTAVTDGRWFVDPANLNLGVGTYAVSVSTGDRTKILASGDVSVSAPPHCEASTPNSPCATIDLSSLTSGASSPTIRGIFESHTGSPLMLISSASPSRVSNSQSESGLYWWSASRTAGLVWWAARDRGTVRYAGNRFEAAVSPPLTPGVYQLRVYNLEAYVGTGGGGDRLDFSGDLVASSQLVVR